jgi:hypothetical protein
MAVSVVSKEVTEFLNIIYMTFIFHGLTTHGLGPPVNSNKTPGDSITLPASDICQTRA